MKLELQYRILFIYRNVTLHLICLYCNYTKTLLYSPPESSSANIKFQFSFQTSSKILGTCAAAPSSSFSLQRQRGQGKQVDKTHLGRINKVKRLNITAVCSRDDTLLLLDLHLHQLQENVYKIAVTVGWGRGCGGSSSCASLVTIHPLWAR